jgi:4-amino-4-deoxy-L-arabinose transferase-like glycosyltransferase
MVLDFEARRFEMQSTLTARRSIDTYYRAIVALFAAIAAFVMVFVVFRSQNVVANGADPYGYDAIARGFVEQGFIKLTRRAASLYPEAIAIVYRLGGDSSTVLFLQALLQIGTCLLAYSLARRLYNPRTALLAGLFCAFHPMLLRYVADLHMESLLTFMCMLTVWAAVNYYERPIIINGIVLGGVGMCATLTKGVMLPILGVYGVVFLALSLRRQSRNDIVALIAMFVTMALVLAPWTYRNYVVTGGKFVLLTPGASDSFLRGYIFTRWEFATLQKPPYTVAENESNDWFRQIARDAGTEWELDEVADEQNNARVARYMIATQPLDTIRKIFVGLFTFWYQMTSILNSMIPASLAIIGWALAFVGLRRAHREGQESWLIWLPIVVMNLFVAILIPLGRYSVPILPCLMILAAFGVDTLLSRRVGAKPVSAG